MRSILFEIVQSKQKHIERLKSVYGELSLKRKYPTRSLYDAIKKSKPSFILECKRRSPSAGVIRDFFDVAAITEVYNHFASAISVVTDEDYFHGSFEFISTVRSSSDLPILCKDFIVSDYQVRLAAHLGADAILLMLSVLNDDQYSELALMASFCGLEILTEVHTAEEIERAIGFGARIIGINNRNLQTMKVDDQTTLRLAPLIPRTSAIISESGITTHRQVREIGPYVDGFLVGSALMMEENLELACSKLVNA